MKLLLLLFAAVVAVSADEATENLLTQANDKFTAKLFNEVVKANPDKSAVLSAYSVLTPLAELALAATGSSQTELLEALSVKDVDQLKKVFSEASSKLRDVKGIEIKTASRIYIPTGYELNDEFLSQSRELFQTDAKNLNFGENVEAAKTINTWVEDQTNNRIKDLVDPNSLTPLTRAILVNAIYFKGTWADAFTEENTRPDKFYQKKDKTVDIPFMHRTGQYKYLESAELNAKLLELPYTGLETSLLVILPNEIDGLPALQEKLTDPSVLPKTMEKLNYNSVEVSLPKFKIETTTDLTEVLQNINITEIFVPGKANLVNLLKSNEDLHISKATQKAFIEVNEKGTEAAAANAFVVGLTSFSEPEPTFKFNADRPFVFGLLKGNIELFSGVFHN